MAKAGAGAIKIQCAIVSRSGACQLDMSPASSGFDYPHIRIEPRESASSAGSSKGKQRQMCTVCKRFFLAAEEVGSRVKCPTLISYCLADVRACGGVRGCSLRLSINNRTMTIKEIGFGRELDLASIVSETNLARGTTSPCESWKREDICVQHCCESVSGQCNRECDCIQFPFGALRQSALAAVSSY